VTGEQGPIEHGTPKGYQQCRLGPETACEACREAHRVYIARWRQQNPERMVKHYQRTAARGRALERLAKRFPREFESLYAAEIAALPNGDAA
jgi:hypothetical protein